MRQLRMPASAISAAALIGFTTLAAAPSAHAYEQYTPYALSGTCSGLEEMQYVVTDSNAITSVTTYGDVPDGRISFKSTAKGCVVVTISSDVWVKDAFNQILLEAVLDDAVVCPPPDNNFASSNSDPNADYPETGDRTMTMLCSGVSPGRHSIQLKMKSGVAGQTVELGKRILAVRHN